MKPKGSQKFQVLYESGHYAKVIFIFVFVSNSIPKQNFRQNEGALFISSLLSLEIRAQNIAIVNDATILHFLKKYR